MDRHALGNTGIDVSRIAFGCGPIPALLTDGDTGTQVDVVRHAVECGINWFDTAATYGEGHSESGLGEALHAVGSPSHVHVATKVRLLPEQLGSIAEAVRESFHASLERLRRPRVTLLQLHNSVTRNRGDLPTSLTTEDVLGSEGVLSVFQELLNEGLVSCVGFTGLGDPHALRELIASGHFSTMQVPYSLANPSAGATFDTSFPEWNHGNVIAWCAEQGMGVFAIRVFAGGALTGRPPAPYTYKTKFFPLDLYERDLARRTRFAKIVENESIEKTALRFSLSHPHVNSAIVGFRSPDEIDQAIAWQAAGPISDSIRHRLTTEPWLDDPP